MYVSLLSTYISANLKRTRSNAHTKNVIKLQAYALYHWRIKKEPYTRHHPAMHALNRLDPSHARGNVYMYVQTLKVDSTLLLQACITIFKRQVGSLFGGWVYGENLCRKETTRSAVNLSGKGRYVWATRLPQTHSIRINS